MVVTKVDEFEVNEAMLTKRPLGLSCASCQKNLVNLSAHPPHQCLAEHQITQKFPPGHTMKGST
jgi:hypothetical protein